ncbi:hypothetical protein ABIC63_005592 [Pseudacidovorax sp. 1753]
MTLRRPHCGFLYLSESEGAEFLLHLAFHNKLLKDSWLNKDYHWAYLKNVSVETQENLVDWLEIIHSADLTKTSPIPYSAHYSGDESFDDDGLYINQNNGTGLTCATFILAATAKFGLKIVDATTWPKNGESFTWFRWIFWMLREYGGDVEASELHKQFLHRRSLKRLHPLEVVVAGHCYDGKVLTYDEVQNFVRSSGVKIGMSRWRGRIL